MKPVSQFAACLLLTLMMTFPSSGMAQSGSSYQIGWDNYKPSEMYVNGIKAAMELGYIPRDTMNLVRVFTVIDSSDIGTTLLCSAPDLRKVNKVWSSVLKSEKPYVFANASTNRRRELYPFVGVEEWVFANDEDAKRGMRFLSSGMIGSTPFNLRKPPREFVRVTNKIYYFYTFPANFYPNLVQVRDVFIKGLMNPEIVR